MLRTTVLACGSPHGDDRAAWVAVEQLTPQLPPGARTAVLAEPLRLLDHTAGRDRLVVVDACRSGRPPGSLVRLAWPEPALRAWGALSSHGLGVGAALALAESLGQLPADVVLLAVELDHDRPGAGLSAAVAAALPALAEQIAREVTRPPRPAGEFRQGRSAAHP